MSTEYNKKGLPDDLLTSKVYGERRIKVDADVELQLIKAMIGLESSNSKILEQMKLLNIRFEEAFDTKLTEADNE
jgi:hypothetical protein